MLLRMSHCSLVLYWLQPVQQSNVREGPFSSVLGCPQTVSLPYTDPNGHENPLGTCSCTTAWDTPENLTTLARPEPDCTRPQVFRSCSL